MLHIKAMSGKNTRAKHVGTQQEHSEKVYKIDKSTKEQESKEPV